MRILLLIAITALTVNASVAGNYAIEEFSESSKAKPFSIIAVEPVHGELRLFIESDNIAEIPKMLNNGSLMAQLSDGEDAVTVPLSLVKAVRCKDADTFNLGYSEPMPDCDIEQIQYYLRAPVTLGPYRDLAIGIDPDFLWLIEEK